MTQHNTYKFFIDVSGNLNDPDEDLFIGCILINEHFISAFRDKFYRSFASLRSFKKKGSRIHPDKLKNILKFMNDNHIHMTIVSLPRHIIKRTRTKLETSIRELKKLSPHTPVQIRNFEVRLMGLTYFQALKQHAYKKTPYECHFCIESQYSIKDCFVTLTRVAYANEYNFMPSAVYRRVTHMLKFADFVASSGRKVDKFIIDTMPYITYIQYEPSQEELNHAFSLSRHNDSNLN